MRSRRGVVTGSIYETNCFASDDLRPAVTGSVLRFHTEVTRHAAPLAAEIYPCVREPAAPFKGLPLVLAFFEIGSGDDCGVPVHANLHII
jgi:hypothetical protein